LDNVTFDLNYDYTFFKAIIITAVFATVYAFLIQTYMQQFTTASKTAIIFAMEPVSASIYAFLAAGEVLSLVQITGAVLIILATLIAEIKFKKRIKHTL
jgi:drug/metabolite transporter (DMT)-like permease